MRPWSPIETLDNSFPYKTLSQDGIPPCLHIRAVLLRKFKAGWHYPPPGETYSQALPAWDRVQKGSRQATDYALAQVRYMC